MDRLNVFVDAVFAGVLIEVERGRLYEFAYNEEYHGSPVSLTMPVSKRKYAWNRFPPFFDGVLPEGFMLEALLKRSKIDRHDYMIQLAHVGGDLVGNVTVRAS